jgi:hypothetical protein
LYETGVKQRNLMGEYTTGADDDRALRLMTA